MHSRILSIGALAIASATGVATRNDARLAESGIGDSALESVTVHIPHVADALGGQYRVKFIVVDDSAPKNDISISIPIPEQTTSAGAALTIKTAFQVSLSKEGSSVVETTNPRFSGVSGRANSEDIVMPAGIHVKQIEIEKKSGTAGPGNTGAPIELWRRTARSASPFTTIQLDVNASGPCALAVGLDLYGRDQKGAQFRSHFQQTSPSNASVADTLQALAGSLQGMGFVVDALSDHELKISIGSSGLSLDAVYFDAHDANGAPSAASTVISTASVR